jgi:putative CocE/NonD family hydrolase
MSVLRAAGLAIVCGLAAAAAAPAPAGQPAGVRLEKNVEARMRDGVILRADVYRPPAPGRYPVLLQRTPYSKNDRDAARRFGAIAARGYVVVVQDTRGRYMSEGTAVPHDEGDDGADSVQWAASLPEADGRVGMFGGSYLATTQLQAATRQPPALVALYPASSYSRRHDMVFQGGAFYLSDGLAWNLGQAMDVQRRVLTPRVDRDGPIGLTSEDSARLRATWLWYLPLKSFDERDLDRFAPGYKQMLAHPDADAFWAPGDIEAQHGRFLVPAFHLTGWYDTLLAGTLRNFTGLRAHAGTETARRHQRIVIGPWTHARPTPASTRIGDVDFGPEAGFDADAAMLAWFDRWLRGAPAREAAPIRLFVMGENRWRDEHEWPLARARQTPYYLRSGGRANTSSGDGRLEMTAPASEPPDRYTYDPRDPVPTGAAGGYSRAPIDRRQVEQRPDVLVYTTPPLIEDVEVTGPIALTLWIRSDARDTDFTGTLVDVFPDGTARALADGILRARYRGGKRAQKLLTPGEAVELTIDLGATSNLFRAGHRIRLEVSSSNFPRFDRNPNTGGVFGEDREVRRAAQDVLHDAAHPSRLVLPIVPRPIGRRRIEPFRDVTGNRDGDSPRLRLYRGQSPPSNVIGASYVADASPGISSNGPQLRAATSGPQATAASTNSAAFERRFMDGVSTESLSAIHRQVTEHPHIAGSPRSMEVADRVRRALEAAGLQTEVHEYLVHLSTPRSIAVDIVSPRPESLQVREPAMPSDPDGAHAELGPAFVAYSASGTVTGPVVYANYGLPPDYARLAANGVDVRGKIVVARYARSHRAVKIHTAEQAGAAGIIIYSDPADDGYARGLTWPDGPWRADFQSQSGNGKYSWFWHGDPLTPGVAATSDARALDPAGAPTLPKIPAVVLPYREAARILSRLEGPPVPSGFQGALPFTYRLGPGPVTVRLAVQMDAGRRPIRNIVGTIAGRDPDRWILLGTHHDAWSFGGMDPGTGLSPAFEVARGLAALARAGWQPERSIKFAFWDAEEFGLVGSTEFAEALQAELREKAIVYINTDLTMRGRFDAGGTPSLRDFLVQVAKDVPHHDGGSVYERWRAEEWARQPLERRRRGDEGFEVDLAALGSGADFVAFQDFLGLPTLQMEFDFEGSYGPYHSNYDTRRYVERHVDPGFRVSQTLARVLGVAIMRLATDRVLPFRYSYYARKMEDFIDVAGGWAVDDNGRRRVAVSLSAARELAAQASRRAAEIETRLAAAASLAAAAPSRLRAVNDALVRLEQRLLDESEPAEKRWYRHVIYGWNIYSLYEGQPLPGLAEAIRVGDAGAVARETRRVEAALQRFNAGLDDVARLLNDRSAR